MNPTVMCFLFFCWTNPGVVPDGAGGFVPFTNSRVLLHMQEHPDGSLRPYDPALDGMPPDYDAVPGYPPPPSYQYGPPSPQGTVTVGPLHMQEHPGAYYDPPATYYDPPPPPPAHRVPSRPPHHTVGKACYDASGQFIGADNADCRHDPNPAPMPDTRELFAPLRAEPQ